jgi:YebC/PmpR family DNA-binding regulatory protein
MSGHSKWANIKHRKGAADARRGKIFTKLIKEITVAARMGGGDINANPRLRSAILEAKSENMPKDNWERAIKKGTGELEGVNYEESTYEGYGPGGVAILIDSVTDNKNRAVSEIRHALNKYGGNMAESGSVSWIFEPKGYLTIDKSLVAEEALMELALEAGAEDVRDDGDKFEVLSKPGDFEAVKSALEKAKIKFEGAEMAKIPKNSVPVSGDMAEKLIRLLDALDDLDDVQKLHNNADLPDEMVSGG